jgi:hypothetical protein
MLFVFVEKDEKGLVDKIKQQKKVVFEKDPVVLVSNIVKFAFEQNSDTLCILTSYNLKQLCATLAKQHSRIYLNPETESPLLKSHDTIIIDDDDDIPVPTVNVTKGTDVSHGVLSLNEQDIGKILIQHSHPIHIQTIASLLCLECKANVVLLREYIAKSNQLTLSGNFVSLSSVKK